YPIQSLSYTHYYHVIPPFPLVFFFFSNPTATTEIYTLSLHDALPILNLQNRSRSCRRSSALLTFILRLPYIFRKRFRKSGTFVADRKSTRLNSSHRTISYAVFCLKKKKQKNNNILQKNIGNTQKIHEN